MAERQHLIHDRKPRRVGVVDLVAEALSATLGWLRSRIIEPVGRPATTGDRWRRGTAGVPVGLVAVWLKYVA